MRNRNENVEGLNEPHQIEVILDGQRLQLFTVTPNRNRMGDYYADEGVDKHLQLRTRVSAGPHDVGATFLRKNGAFVETERQPYDAHFNMNRHPRLTAGRLHPFHHRALRRRRVSATRRAVSASSSAGRRRARTKPRAPGRIVSATRAPRLPAARHGPRYRGAARALSRGARRRRVRRRHRGRAPRDARPARSSCSGSSAIRRHGGGRALSHQRSGAGLAPVVLPVEQHSRRSSCWTRPSAGACASRRCSTQQVRRMLADPRAEALVDQLRQPVAVSPQSRRGRARPAAVSRFRRQPAAGIPPGDRAVLREHRPGGPQRARSARRRLHVPERTAGQALRRFRTSTATGSGGLPAERQPAPRAAGPRQHPDGDVAFHAHLAGAARQMDSRKHPRHAAAAAAGERAAAGGKRPGRRGADDARADGANIAAMPSCAACHRCIDPLGLALENFDADRPLADARTKTAAADRRVRKHAGRRSTSTVWPDCGRRCWRGPRCSSARSPRS